MNSRAVAALGSMLACAAASAATSPSDSSTSRLVVKIGEQRFTPLPGIDSLVIVDEQVAQATMRDGGFIVTGRSVGDTVAQIFTSSGLHVVVVVVQFPPPPLPGPERRTIAGPHPGPLSSAWGANSYTIGVNQSTDFGTYETHVLSLSGRLQGGEYHADAQAATGARGNQFLLGRLAWTSDNRDRSFEIGDTAGLIAGSLRVPAVPVRGLKVRSGSGSLTWELITGSLSQYGGELSTEPVVGVGVEGAVKLGGRSDVNVGYHSSVLGFSTTDRPDVVGHVGMLAGSEAHFEHRNGFGIGLRSAGVVATPKQEGAPTVASGEMGAEIHLVDRDRSYRLGYDGNMDRFYSPQVHSELPGSQQLSAAAGQRLAKGLIGSASGSYQWLSDADGNRYHGLTYNLGIRLDPDPRTQIVFNAGEISTLFPLSLPGQKTTVFQGHQLQASAGAIRLFGSNARGQLSLGLRQNQTQTGTSNSAILALAGQQIREHRWELSGSTTLIASRQSVLAVDQPPVSMDAGVAGNGRLFLGRSLDAFGGITFQKSITSSISPAVGGNLGMQLTPTAAHHLVATLNVRTRMGTGPWSETFSVAYSYHFGNDVKAEPLFEFMSRGDVDGTVCIDENGDGRCQPTEPPLPNVLLHLSDGRNTQTDAKGHYEFSGVEPGFYHVEVDEQSLRALGRLTTVSSSAFDLPSRGKQQVSFGVSRACHIQGRIVNDLDLDGAMSEGEPLFPGVMVVAIGSEGSVGAQSDGLGGFKIPLRRCGEYEVKVEPASLPASMVVVKSGIRVVASPTETPMVELLVGAIRTVEGTVFLDRNGNGIRDADEPPVVSARVLWKSGAVKTTEEGKFLFRRLPSGEVELSVDPGSLPSSMRPGPPVKMQLGPEPVSLENVVLSVLPNVLK